MRFRGGSVAVALGLYAVVATAFVALAAGGADVTDLLDDPLALGGLDRTRPWNGSLSIVGGMLWIVAATCCALGAAVVASVGGSRQTFRFLLATAAVALLFGLDDLLLIHDALVPFVFDRLGAENVVLAGLLVVAGAWAVVFRREILAGDRALAVLAAGCFATSIGIDVLSDHDGDSVLAAVEDVAKLLGIGTFAALCVQWSWDAITACVAGRSEAADRQRSA